MKTHKNQHVLPHKTNKKKDWAVMGERNKKKTSIKPTKSEAIQRAREIARNQKSEVIIHGFSCRIINKESYKNNSCLI